MGFDAPLKIRINAMLILMIIIIIMPALSDLVRQALYCVQFDCLTVVFYSNELVSYESWPHDSGPGRIAASSS